MSMVEVVGGASEQLLCCSEQVVKGNCLWEGTCLQPLLCLTNIQFKSSHLSREREREDGVGSGKWCVWRVPDSVL